MTRVAVRAVLFSTTLFGLAACEDGLNLGGGTSADAEAPAPAVSADGAVRDVQRPDIFQTQEEALWDGRPSLGGIWVAHPDVTTPERAIIVNETTGQRIAGALFRRERDNPGPRIQLSSDAAAALNILAGQPTEVSVVAVRQEEIEVEEPDPVISDEDIGDDAESSDGDGGAAAATAAAAAGATEAATPEKPRGNFFQRLFGGNRRTTATDTAAAADAGSGEAPTESAAAPSVETQPLDPVTTGAAAAIAAADEDDKPAPRPERTEAPSGLRNPFVQVGLFTVEANAFSARDNLRSAGIVPTVLEGSNDSGPFWRVVVGPVTTKDDQAKLLAQVKNLGFRDAFLTDR